MPYTSISQICRNDGSVAMETMLIVSPDTAERHWTAIIFLDSLNETPLHNFSRISLAILPTRTDMVCRYVSAIFN